MEDGLLGRDNTNDIKDEVHFTTEQKKTKFWVLKALYFLLAGSIAGLLKFLPVYYHKLDFDAKTIAWLLTGSSMSSFIGGLFWGWLADHTGCYKEIIIITATLSSGLVFGFTLARVEASEYYMLVTVSLNTKLN